MRVAVALQNVGGIDLSIDLGDTVPIKRGALALESRGHKVGAIALQGRSVVHHRHVAAVDSSASAEGLPLHITGSGPFKTLESAIRRAQRVSRLPYFALFDSLRFLEGCSYGLAEYDLCHEHTGLLGFGAALACKRLRKPYVVTFGADPILEHQIAGTPLSGIQRSAAVVNLRFVLRSADAVVCVSEAAKRQAMKNWGVKAGRIVVLPNGVDTELFRPPSNGRPTAEQIGLTPGAVVGFVGGFHVWHGIDVLVESFAIVARSIPEAKLLLIGDGPARRSIAEKVVELDLELSTHMTGYVDQRDLPELLSVIDIAVLPYPELPSELWFSPLKLYEYMAAEKAIVASRAGQIAEVIKNGITGVLVRPGSAQELAKSIIRLLQDPVTRERLGRNAREQAVQKHSWGEYARRLEATYENVLQGVPVAH